MSQNRKRTMGGNLADRYQGKFGGNTKAITSLAATVKRTRTALNTIQEAFRADGYLTEKDIAILQSAALILSNLTPVVDGAKTKVKRHAAEKQRLEERLKKEATQAVTSAFTVDQVGDMVALLSWEHKLKRFAGSYWRKNVREEFTFDSWRHKNRPPNVIRELKSQVNDLIREIINSVVSEAWSEDRPVSEIVTEAKADFEARRPTLLNTEEQFIQDVKTAAVTQAIETAK